MQRRRVQFLTGGYLLLVLLTTQSTPYAQIGDTLKERYYAALKLVGQDEFDAGIARLRGIILENPAYAKPYRNLVETYIFANQLDDARGFFGNVLESYPNNAYAYYALARIDFAQKDYDVAMEKLKRCINLDAKYPDAYSHRGGLPEVYRANKDLEEGIEFFKRQIAAQPNNACAYYGLARCYIRTFQYEEALKELERALELDPRLMLAYHAKIQCHSRLSQYRKVLDVSEDALAIAKDIDDLEMAAYANMMIGTAYQQLGDYLRALQYLDSSLRIAKTIGDKTREAVTLNNLANVYYSLGDFGKALPYFNQALFFARKTGDTQMELRALTNIGNVHMVEGRHDEANQNFDEVLKLARRHSYKGTESRALSNLASVFKQSGHTKRALDYWMQALRVAQEINDRVLEGFILLRLGLLQEESSNFYHYLTLAREIGKEIRHIQLIWQTEAALGWMFAGRGEQDKAIKHYANAISLYDSVRANLDIESLAFSFLEERYEPYTAIVQFLAEEADYEKAFIYGEKYKAKNLLEILSQGESLALASLPASVRRQLQIVKYQLEQAHKKLSRELLKDSASSSRRLNLEQAITSLQLKQASIMRDLKNKQNVYYQLTSAEVLAIPDIQKRVLTPGQALVNYIVGSEAISIFAVTPDCVGYAQTPIGSDSLRSMLALISPFFRSIGNRNIQMYTPQLADFTATEAFKVYETIFKPIEPYLQTTQEIIILPDDVLFRLPFEMLVYDTTGIQTKYDFGEASFLLERYAISYAPSASLMNPDLRRPPTAVKGVFAVGNPDFYSSLDHPEPSGLLVAKTADLGMATWTDDLLALPNTESEVRAISDVFVGSENRILLGADATEADFKAETQGFRIVHVATHFLPMDDQPLYSKIALSRGETSAEDGYLQTYEVLNLELDAELVVLSACNTGSGRVRKGEGVIGIARAFQHAGVPSLVASLWSVDDASTASIMKLFYQYLKEGHSKSKALQLAKLGYLDSSDSAGRDPFYWAPFVLIGDPSAIHFTAEATGSIWPVWLALLTMTAIATLLVRKWSRFRLPK